ncbi:hypothetical protein GCM10028803_14700 [Larkinella knui]|uniref:T9SS C-terminal target domain-containing protein n=1 Tax=Larkinella knui TaxID=2025310 RepID=A0A3P1CAF4_9BACT|nr:hypothetical protein [Larkinella knui]RRB09844.1 hypothetical protein EHT87_30455 [Larkinella knui]
MKTLIKSLLVAFALTAVTCAVSQAETNQPNGQPKKIAAFQSSLYTTTEGKIQIALHKETSGKVLVRLTNRAGTEFFAEQIGKRRQAARLRLDVSALPDGVYQVSISNGVQTTTQELTLATRQTKAAPRLVAVN